MLACALLAGASMIAAAAALPTDDAERACWLSHTRERTRVDFNSPSAVAFSNLRNGDVVTSPLLVEFAVRGMGVAPAGKPLKGTGHHHLLIDTPLPSSISDPIPFSATYRHFGKGQTSTLLELAPGRHTLRLLFADHEHRPYFLFSPEVAILVRGPRSSVPRPQVDPHDQAGTCAAWYADAIARPRPPDEPLYVANLRAGETLNSPFNLRFGVDGLGVCARGLEVEKTGTFRLEVLARTDRHRVQAYDLVNGSTQANVFVPVGAYTLRLHFVDPASGRDLLAPQEMPIEVVGQDRI